MKRSLLAVLTAIIMAGAASAQAPAQPADKPAAAPAAAAPTDAPRVRKIKRVRKKNISKNLPGVIDPKKVNILLYGTMERIEVLSGLFENLSLRVSTDTLKKAFDLDRTANKLAAGYFKTQEPKADRESIKSYRGLMDSALRSVKLLKEIKDRVRPEESQEALLACRDFYLAMDEELATLKLINVPVVEPKPAAETPAPEQPKPNVEAIPNETETLFTISEVNFALDSYKRDEGKYPKHLKDLTPKYMTELPAISIADHPKTSEVIELDSRDYDADISKAITDTGKWIYFSHKKSKHYGRVFVDCSHKDAQGVEFYTIGAKK